MKKLVIALVAFAAVAHADITVNLFTEYGLFAPNGVDAFLADGETATITLNNAADDSEIGDPITMTADIAAGDWSEYVYLTGTTIEDSALAGASVYALAVNNTTAWYFQGATVAVPDVDLAGTPAPTPASYNFGGADGGVAIPEPATVGLMGIAATALFAARRNVRG